MGFSGRRSRLAKSKLAKCQSSRRDEEERKRDMGSPLIVNKKIIYSPQAKGKGGFGFGEGRHKEGHRIGGNGGKASLLRAGGKGNAGGGIMRLHKSRTSGSKKKVEQLAREEKREGKEGDRGVSSKRRAATRRDTWGEKKFGGEGWSLGR